MGDAGQGARYRAFISYSHVDKAFGRRLHRRLESYAVPRRLVGRQTPRGPAPRRVAPVFRDREEFSAAGDLTAEVRAALEASAALIVVCSPAAAASPWVAREVELFRELHPDRPILAALARGEPAQAFPTPLTTAGGAAVEPLAADFRPEGDGPRLALLKLVAGVLGLGLDQLVQRDAQQRLRSVTAITAGAVSVALAMTGLTTFALLARADAQRQRGEAEIARVQAERQRAAAVAARNDADRQRAVAVGARNEAQRQRTEAEDLVEFMQTDLRNKLKAVGRLDVMESANEHALAYYNRQGVTHLAADSRARYARILMALGEDDLTSARRAAALKKFRSADAITSALFQRSPSNTDRVWDQAQSEYWLGYYSYLSNEPLAAKARWTTYRALAQRLVDRTPSEPRYLRELSYAEGDLCTLAIKAPDRPAALQHCAASLLAMETAVRKSPEPSTLDSDLANRHGWMSEAYKNVNDNVRARAEREAESTILRRLMVADPKDATLMERWVAMQRSMSGLDYRDKDFVSSRRRLIEADEMLGKMLAIEPANDRWREQRSRIIENLKLVANANSSARE